MEDNFVSCPYCGCKITNDVERCPQCHEYFTERSLPIKVDSLGWFLVLNIITLGLYQTIWILKNLSKINDMALSKKDKLKLDIPVCILILSVLYLTVQFVSYIVYLFGFVSKLQVLVFLFFWLLSSPVFLLSVLLLFVISYRILRIIEKYTYHKYGIKIYHSEWGFYASSLVLVTPLFYLIYFIYTYKVRVYNPKVITI